MENTESKKEKVNAEKAYWLMDNSESEKFTISAPSNEFLGGWDFFPSDTQENHFNIIFSGNKSKFRPPNLFRRIIIRVLLGWRWVDKDPYSS